MPTLLERVAAIETLARQHEQRLDNIESEVTTGEGISPRLPLRTRMHSIEGARAAESAAQAALSAMRAGQRADRNVQLTKLNVALVGLGIAGPLLAKYFMAWVSLPFS